MLYAVPKSISERISKLSSLSYNQQKLAAEYVTGLIVASSKSALGISKSVAGANYKSLERLLTEYPFSCEQMNRERLALAEAHNELRSSAKHGVLILDDTGVEKQMQGAYKYYDHAEQRFKQGFVLVTLAYADHKTSYPVDAQRYAAKQAAPEHFKTKIEIAKQLVQRNSARVKFRFAVFDSWYLCSEMHSFMRGLDKHWISRVKSDRLVLYKGKYVSLGEYSKLVKHKAKTVAGKLVYASDAKLRCIGERVKLVAVYEGEETYFLASSLVSIKAEDLLRFYSLRFLIDVFHRDAKQHLGLGEWKVRSLEGAERHWHLLMLAYTLLRLEAASEELVKRVFSAGKSIVRQVRLFGFLALMELVLLVAKKGSSVLLAELVRNGGVRMG